MIFKKLRKQVALPGRYLNNLHIYSHHIPIVKKKRYSEVVVYNRASGAKLPFQRRKW